MYELSGCTADLRPLMECRHARGAQRSNPIAYFSFNQLSKVLSLRIVLSADVQFPGHATFVCCVNRQHKQPSIFALRLSSPPIFTELSAGITRMGKGRLCIETRRPNWKGEVYVCFGPFPQNENAFYYSWSLCHHNGVERKVFKPLWLKISWRRYKLILSTSLEKMATCVCR